jgi:MFS family permease
MLVLFCEVVWMQLTMTSVVVRQIGVAFPASGNSISWAITISTLVAGATIALVGKMADLWGKKRVMFACAILFLIGTVICATTSSWPVFLLGRGLEAPAVALGAIAYGLVRDLMPRSWIPVSVGLIGTGLGVSAVAAPLIAGALTDHYSWRSIFWFLAIYMAVAIPLFAVVVPETKLRVRQRLDFVGALLIGVGFAGALIYLSEGSSWGWTSAGNVGYLIGGLVALGLFVVWENKTADPLLELSLLRSPAVATVLAISFFATGVLLLVNYTVPYMFQTGQAAVKQAVIAAAAAKAHLPASLVAKGIQFRGDISYAQGYSLMQVVLHITLWATLMGAICGPLGGALARRSGARRPLIIGMLALLVALAGLTVWHNTWQEQLVFGLIFGVGFGFFFAAAPNLLIDAVPRERQGVTAGMFSVFGSIGAAFAIAILTSILVRHPYQIVATSPTGGHIVANIPQVYTSAGWGQVYLLVGVVGSLIALLLALWLKSGRTPARGGEFA